MSCVACGVSFDADSDIVVCPECGAPHHRECWKAAGQCACADRHGDGYEWQPKRIVIGDTANVGRQESASPANAFEQERVICPMCGNETLKSEKYCERCGYYLAHDREGAYENDDMPEFVGLFDFDSAEPIDGVPAGDIRRFVGSMWVYYIPRFIKMSRNHGSLSFNFTAFLMHGLWFVSRKMYGIGLPLMLLMTGTTCYRAYYAHIAQSLDGDRLLFFTSIYFLLAGLEFLVMVLCGIFGNRLYMRFCAAKVKKINARATAANATASQFNEAVEEEGGVALIPSLSVSICYLALLYVLQRGLLF